MKILNTSTADEFTKSFASEVISRLETSVKNYESIEKNTVNAKTSDLTHLTPLVRGKYHTGGERAKKGATEAKERQISEAGASGHENVNQISQNTDTYKNISESLKEIYKTGEVISDLSSVTDKQRSERKDVTYKLQNEKLTDSTTTKQLDTFSAITSLEKTASDLVTFEKIDNSDTVSVNNIDHSIATELDRRTERIERAERQKTKDIDESRLLKAVLSQLRDMNNTDSDTVQGNVRIERRGNVTRRIRNA